MRAPVGFVYGNCVFGDGLDDGWATFAVECETYGWLGEEAKRARFFALLGGLEALEADVQILRVGRRWEVERYVRELDGEALASTGGAGTHAHARARRRYLDAHRRRLSELQAVRPQVFLLVSLSDPERDVATYVSKVAEQHPREWWEGLRRVFSVRDRRLLKVSELERARVRADQAHARLADYLPVRQARGVELQWLIRRAFCRGLGEPEVDGLHEPRALVFERNGEATLAPLEGDVLRWMDGYVEHRGRALRIDSELGTSWQAQLVLGALPERTHFPGARAELMFAPAESLPFAIDLSLNARFLPNELALRIARRRIQDADQILRAESDGEQGSPIAGMSARRRPATCSPICRLRAGRHCYARRSRSRSPRVSRRSSRSGSRCAGELMVRSGCIALWEISCGCSCSTCRDSARRWRAMTTRSRRSRSRR
ncbi:MAG TPA: hypothetical protein VGL68_02415 [Solirubrobacteraceae bacterium]